MEVRVEGAETGSGKSPALTAEAAHAVRPQRLERKLESTLGRLNHLKGQEYIRTSDI